MKVHFDLETADPDDVMALCLLATHPRVELVGVTVFPGGLDQVGLVRRVLYLLGRSDVGVGANPRTDSEKKRVSPFYAAWFGPITPKDPDGTASEILAKSSKKGATLLTGAALTNIWAFHEATTGDLFPAWICQGGFAGDNVVPEADRLPKFAGKVTCPTFNLNGNPKAAQGLLASKRMGTISMVSKNVCHGFWFGPARVAALPRGEHLGLTVLLDGMTHYLARHKDGKALHDILAAVLAFTPDLATWVNGVPYRERGEWGFTPDASSTTRIVTRVDEDAVLKAMAE